MLKIKGLDRLQKEMNEVTRALNGLDGLVGEITFDPDDNASVRNAIRKMERSVDQKIARYRHNPMVASTADAAKSTFKSAILKKAKVRSI